MMKEFLVKPLAALPDLFSVLTSSATLRDRYFWQALANLGNDDDGSTSWLNSSWVA